jgi:hypothetical protein
MLKVSKNGRLYWIDYGIDQEGLGHHATAFVMQLLGEDEQSALQDIKERMESGETPPVSNYTPKIIRKELYGQKLREWETCWWEKNLLFDKPHLDFFNVVSLKGYYREDRLVWESTEEVPAYLYLDYNKAYRPTAPKGRKHRGIENRTFLEGWEQLPWKADHFIAQSSYKDVMTFRKMGYLGAAPTSENSLSELFKRAREIDARFDKKFVLFDNDAAGRKSAAKVKELLGWTPIFCRTTKDPSDSVQKTGNYFELSNLMSNFDLSKYHI